MTADRGRRQLLRRIGVIAGASVAGGWATRLLVPSSHHTANAAAAGELPAARRPASIPQQPFALDGITPYLTPNERFFQIDTAIVTPQIDLDAWRLTIGGRVDHPRSYRYGDLLAMRLVEEIVTLACVSNDVGGTLVGTARWLGVPLRDLLAKAGVHDDATQIVARATDDFTADFSTAAALDGRVAMIALGMNGVALPGPHGFPARLVVAGLYGYASATKWLTAIELTRREDHQSYWVERGWAKDGAVKLQSRFDVPEAGERVPRDKVRLGGVAWSAGTGISAVDVKIDEQPWRRAELGAARVATWTPWLFEWRDAAPGDHVAAVRATDGGGRLQVEDASTPEPSGATGYHYRSFSVD